MSVSGNSSLRVERRKRGNAQRALSSSHEAEGDRDLSSAGMTARGRKPRVVNVRDNFQSRSPSTKCCELYASLHDRFRLEVRILFYPMRTLKLVTWVTLIIAGTRGWAGRGKPRRGVRGRSPRLSRNELKMFHKQILSRNEAWFVKIRRQMTDITKQLWNIFSNQKWQKLSKIFWNKKWQIVTKQLSKIFSNKKNFQTLNVVSCVPYAMVHRSELQWTRGERVPLSLYFISILWLHSKDDRKGDRFFRFQTITGAQVRFFFLFLLSSLSFLLSVYGLAFFFSILTTLFLTFFSTFSIRPSVPSLFHCPTGHESRRFQCQNRIKEILSTCYKKKSTPSLEFQ